MNVRAQSFFFFFSSRRRHTRSTRDWSSDVCSSDLAGKDAEASDAAVLLRLFERQLEAEADAEHRRPGLDSLDQSLVDTAPAQPFHRGRGGADAGQHCEIRR